jgi:transcriptional regulator with XRE-family HTH domain
MGEIIRTLRERKQMSQEELGRLVELNQNTISMYENGNRTPTIKTLDKLASALGVSKAYLLGEKGNRNAKNQANS